MLTRTRKDRNNRIQHEVRLNFQVDQKGRLILDQIHSSLGGGNIGYRVARYLLLWIH